MQFVNHSFRIFLMFFCGINFLIGQSEWITFSSEAPLKFSVYAPGEMEKSVKSIKTAVGELQTETYSYQGTAEDENYLYLVNLVQYPEGAFPPDSLGLINDYLENSISSSVDRVGGELVYSSDLDSNNGKLFRIKYNDGGAVIKGKSFIKNDVFINVQVFTIQNKSLNDEMDVFLDSFKVKF
ncbi:MAG: hypothetical protein P1U56_10805 [Saprospiraceae bacterium]|nr:hypothetical protein [Saprospiraceae bacterium]